MTKAARYCVIVTGVLQLLFALLSFWILIDLNFTGTLITPLALVFGAALVIIPISIVVVAWQLRPDSRLRLWFLVTIYSLVLALLAILALFYCWIDFKPLILRPGAALTPNEIMGREWPIALAIMSASAATALSILPLVVVGATLFLRWQKSPTASDQR